MKNSRIRSLTSSSAMWKISSLPGLSPKEGLQTRVCHQISSLLLSELQMLVFWCVPPGTACWTCVYMYRSKGRTQHTLLSHANPAKEHQVHTPLLPQLLPTARHIPLPSLRAQVVFETSSHYSMSHEILGLIWSGVFAQI